jgi:crotonobetainyl-CoA:carnitine CoA-transferase CaiB-like acyl-CoA transferase
MADASVAPAALGQLMRLAARPEPDFVTIEAGPPAMPTRFHAEEAAAAALAATGVLAADIWSQRTGQGQTVSVNTREAAADLTSLLSRHGGAESALLCCFAGRSGQRGWAGCAFHHRPASSARG